MAQEFLGLRYSSSDVNIDQKQYATEAESYARQTVDLGIERYRITIILELDSKGAKMAASKLRRHRQKHGLHSRFTMPMPQDLGIGDAPEGDVTAAEDTDKGDSTVVVTKDSQSVVIPEGRFFTFSGHKKVYVIDSERRLAGNNVEITIQPALQKSVDDGEALDFTPDVTVKYALDAVMRFDYFDGILNRLSLSVVEDVNAP